MTRPANVGRFPLTLSPLMLATVHACADGFAGDSPETLCRRGCSNLLLSGKNRHDAVVRRLHRFSLRTDLDGWLVIDAFNRAEHDARTGGRHPVFEPCFVVCGLGSLGDRSSLPGNRRHRLTAGVLFRCSASPTNVLRLFEVAIWTPRARMYCVFIAWVRTLFSMTLVCCTIRRDCCNFTGGSSLPSVVHVFGHMAQRQLVSSRRWPLPLLSFSPARHPAVTISSATGIRSSLLIDRDFHLHRRERQTPMTLHLCYSPL